MAHRRLKPRVLKPKQIRPLCYYTHAALATPRRDTQPNALCEAVLLGAGRSYKYLSLMTLLNSVAIGSLCRLAIAARPDASSAWLCILLFFTMRLATSAGRIFVSGRGGFGHFGRAAPAEPSSQIKSGF